MNGRLNKVFRKKLNTNTVIKLLNLSKHIYMEDSKSKKASADAPKKITRKQIEKKLETALSNLRPVLGEKKFKRRIKKAGKLITSGLKNFRSNGKVKEKKEKVSTSSVKNENV